MPKTQPKILALVVLSALALPGVAWADCPWEGSVMAYLGCEFDEVQGLLLDVFFLARLAEALGAQQLALGPADQARPLVATRVAYI